MERGQPKYSSWYQLMWIFSSLFRSFAVFKASSPHLSPRQEALGLRGNVRFLRASWWPGAPSQPPTHTCGAFELLINSSCSMCNSGTDGKRLRSRHNGQALVSSQPSITAQALMESRRDPVLTCDFPAPSRGAGGGEISFFFFLLLRIAGEQESWQSSCHKE